MIIFNKEYFLLFLIFYIKKKIIFFIRILLNLKEKFSTIRANRTFVLISCSWLKCYTYEDSKCIFNKFDVYDEFVIDLQFMIYLK